MEKKNFLPALLSGVMQLLLAALSLGAAGVLVYCLLFSVGRPSGTAAAGGTDAGVIAKFQNYTENEISDALEGVISIRKKYWIGEHDLAAPVPNASCYGETDDPTTLGWLLEDAQELLDGQSLYFHTDVKLMPGTTVRYYKDDTILAITWKTPIDNMIYTFSEIKIAHPSQFRRFIAEGQYGSEKLFITTEMAQSVNAVVASSGDYYLHRNAGIVVYDGVVHKANNGLADTCFVDAEGNLSFFGRYEYMDMKTAQQYVDEHNIRFSLVFGPILVRDGKTCTPKEYLLGEINDEYARSALCQMGDKHYLLAIASAEGAWAHVPTIHRFARRVQETGCQNAYALDGGQTAAIVMNNQLINRVVYGYQRRISDIIYFATAIPNGG